MGQNSSESSNPPKLKLEIPNAQRRPIIMRGSKAIIHIQLRPCQITSIYLLSLLLLLIVKFVLNDFDVFLLH